MPLSKVSTVNLQLGMYVSELDRPWRETPFLFQGFQIQEEGEIDQLKQHCQHVYVVLPDEEVHLDSKLQGGWEAVSLTTPEQRSPCYSVMSEFDEELTPAKTSHEQLTQLAGEMGDVIRKGEDIDVPAMKESVHLMVESVLRNPDPFLWLVRLKNYDSYTYRHMVNVSVMATTFGRYLGLSQDELETIAIGCMCIDLGMLKLEQGILEKQERLSWKEMNIIKSHVHHSIEILARNDSISEDIIHMVQTHHERHDGTGYPNGTKGNNIPRAGCIAGIVDTYTAITSPRVYAPARSSAHALQFLFDTRNKQFEEQLVFQFIQLIGLYPTGSLVELSTGEVALVMSHNPGWRTRPKVILLLDPGKKAYGSFPIVNLLTDTHDKNGTPISIERGVGEDEFDIDYTEIHF